MRQAAKRELARLTAVAAEFARCYVALVRELMAAGMPEDEARAEARATAWATAMGEEEQREPWRG